MDLNKAMIIGRATKDAEVRSTPSGANVTSFSLATNFSYTNQQSGQKVDQVEFHNIVAWRGLADVAGKYVKKGKRVYIEGRITTRKWQTQTGEQRQTTEIIADNLILLDGGSPSGESSARPQENPRPTGYSKPESDQPIKSLEEELPTIDQDELSIEDVPF